jgi:hypothetical protein
MYQKSTKILNSHRIHQCIVVCHQWANIIRRYHCFYVFFNLSPSTTCILAVRLDQVILPTSFTLTLSNFPRFFQKHLLILWPSLYFFLLFFQFKRSMKGLRSHPHLQSQRVNCFSHDGNYQITYFFQYKFI